MRIVIHYPKQKLVTELDHSADLTYLRAPVNNSYQTLKISFENVRINY